MAITSRQPTQNRPGCGAARWLPPRVVSILAGGCRGARRSGLRKRPRLFPLSGGKQRRRLAATLVGIRSVAFIARQPSRNKPSGGLRVFLDPDPQP
jgi:hypothetical protein